MFLQENNFFCQAIRSSARATAPPSGPLAVSPGKVSNLRLDAMNLHKSHVMHTAQTTFCKDHP